MAERWATSLGRRSRSSKAPGSGPTVEPMVARAAVLCHPWSLPGLLGTVSFTLGAVTSIADYRTSRLR